MINYDKVYTLKHIESGICLHCRWDKKITSFDRLVRLGGKGACKPVGPGFDGSEPATRWKGIK